MKVVFTQLRCPHRAAYDHNFCSEDGHRPRHAGLFLWDFGNQTESEQTQELLGLTTVNHVSWENGEAGCQRRKTGVWTGAGESVLKARQSSIPADFPSGPTTSSWLSSRRHTGTSLGTASLRSSSIKISIIGFCVVCKQRRCLLMSVEKRIQWRQRAISTSKKNAEICFQTCYQPEFLGV